MPLFYFYYTYFFSIYSADHFSQKFKLYTYYLNLSIAQKRYFSDTCDFSTFLSSFNFLGAFDLGISFFIKGDEAYP